MKENKMNDVAVKEEIATALKTQIPQFFVPEKKESKSFPAIKHNTINSKDGKFIEKCWEFFKTTKEHKKLLDHIDSEYEETLPIVRRMIAINHELHKIPNINIPRLIYKPKLKYEYKYYWSLEWRSDAELQFHVYHWTGGEYKNPHGWCHYDGTFYSGSRKLREVMALTIDEAIDYFIKKVDI